MVGPTHISRRTFLLCLGVLTWIGGVRADDVDFLERHVEYHARLADGAATAPRQYAPDRKVDILHVTIDVTPDFERCTVAGTTAITFAPIARDLEVLRLDAIDLDVSAVTSAAAISGYSVTDDAITITFAPPITPDLETTVTVSYEAEPSRGLYFRTPRTGYREEDMHLYTQGETHEAPHWYPNYDYPNERFTSKVICRVPPEMVVLSNGRLVSEQEDPNTGLKAVAWLQDKPHVNYLIALAAGRFKKIEARHRDIPLAFYTPASQIHLAENSFRGTADMIDFYEDEIGVAYPWDKYYQVVCQDFGGGMENTSLTILTDGTLFTDASENIRSSRGLVAHELVHQWFGDYVTCKDWSHIWLNEGFAVYYEKLYDRHANGRDSFLHNLYQGARGILTERDFSKPIVSRSYASAWEQFDYRAYTKGAWVLHMLRTELGEALFRQCIKTYLEHHALGTVVTEDLNSIIEELSGRSFDRFFDQWVYHAGHPKLTVRYNWSRKDKLARVSVEQTQETNDSVLLFHFRTKVRFVIDGTAIDREIVVDKKKHDFYFALPEEPTIVRFDPDFGLLADVTFDPPTAMRLAQLKDPNDVIGRLLAIKAMKGKKDQRTVAALAEALNGDPFWGVRVQASGALRAIHTDEAFDALAQSLAQPDARVRARVVMDIGGFYRPESLRLSRQILQTETNPEILASALHNLGRYNDADSHKLLVRYLKEQSFRNRLADAAISAMRTMDDPVFIPPLKRTLQHREDEFTTWGFASALSTLARLARNEEDKTPIRSFLADYVNHPKQRVQVGAISALGALGDPKAIPMIETYTADEPGDRLQRAAKRALEGLREKKPLVPEEVTKLRRAIDEVKKDNEDLRSQLQEIKDRLDAKDKAEDKGVGTEEEGSSADPQTGAP